MKYIIGDRVRVVWLCRVYTAVVIKVHPSDAVDVVYDLDNSVGVSLTAAEHILEVVEGETDAYGVAAGTPKEKVRVYLTVFFGDIQGGVMSCDVGADPS